MTSRPPNQTRSPARRLRPLRGARAAGDRGTADGPPAALTDEPPAGAPPAGAPQIAAAAMPSTLAIVSRGLHLNVAASAEIRRVSLYIGLLTLLSVGPIAAVLWAFSARQGGFEWLQRLARGLSPSSFPSARGSGSFLCDPPDRARVPAGPCGRCPAPGDDSDRRPRHRSRFSLGSALALGRLRFWRLVRASALIGLILLIPRSLVNQVVMGGRPVGRRPRR